MGDNAATRLKREGVEVSKTDVLTVRLDQLFLPPKEGHALSRVWHPRGELTADDPGIAKLRDLIVEDGEIREPALVREDWIRNGPDGKTGDKVKVLTLVDGAGRRAAGKLAEAILQSRGRCKDGLRIRVRLFVGSDAELLLARQAADVQPGKRPHGPAHLAEMTRQYLGEGGKLAEWMKVMPPYIREYRLTERDVEAFTRWGNLHESVARALDTGLLPRLNGQEAEPVSFGLFRALLDEPRDEQPGVMLRLIQEGAKTVKGATLVKNRDAKREKVKLPGLVAPPPVRRPHPKAMRKAIEGADGLGLKDESGVTATLGDRDTETYNMGAADGFMWGMRFALGEVDIDGLVALGFPDALAHHVKAALRPEKGAAK